MLRRARIIHVHGIVQGVGFRPFAYRLAQRYQLNGWVCNGGTGVEIHLEGTAGNIAAFEGALRAEAPPAARIVDIESVGTVAAGCTSFVIRQSDERGSLSVPISPDLATCGACLAELFDSTNRRFRYPYITCTDCGPRYSIVRKLPYDRAFTTMAEWTMCNACSTEYHDPGDRRFHAQPIACHACGPVYVFEWPGRPEQERGDRAIVEAARALAAGALVAVKGIGGYHLACDARNAQSVALLRERKFRKERPFAVMAADITAAETLVVLDSASRTLLTSSARPIVLASARGMPAGVAPG